MRNPISVKNVNHTIHVNTKLRSFFPQTQNPVHVHVCTSGQHSSVVDTLQWSSAGHWVHCWGLGSSRLNILLSWNSWEVTLSYACMGLALLHVHVHVWSHYAAYPMPCGYLFTTTTNCSIPLHCTSAVQLHVYTCTLWSVLIVMSVVMSIVCCACLYIHEQSRA